MTRLSGEKTTGKLRIFSQNETQQPRKTKPIRDERRSAQNFIARVKDEPEGETYEIFVGQKNGAEIDIITMTYKQALQVID
ncbi:hypothetical protein G991_02261 [Escherichia coli UMEA 3703-1]|nr:hypothetical protein G991_02261 [Escherichia coli UMEA 3703-1]